MAVKWIAIFENHGDRIVKLMLSAIILVAALAAIVQPVVAAPKDQSLLSWETPLGEGGARVPELPEFQKNNDIETGLTKVVAVVFPPDTHDILFIGEREAGKQILFTPESLSDALVVSYRAQSRGEAPGVSIDYTKAQERCMYLRDRELSRSGKSKYKPCINENDLLKIRYIGGDKGTEVGLVAFEADRLMKSLGLGKDSKTKKPLRSRVSGFHTRLELGQKYPMRYSQSTHRFWIEPQNGSVERSSDGRTLVVKSNLGVQVKYQVSTSGGMVDAKREADQGATAFAEHMSGRYADYGAEFPVFAKLAAFSQMTYAARALLAPSRNSGNSANIDRTVDHEWMLNGYKIRSVDTEQNTVASIVLGEWQQKAGGVSVRPSITGGVDLTPTTSRNDPGPYSTKADKFQLASLAAYGRHPRRPGNIKIGRKKYNVVVARKGSISRLKSWQTDYKSGALSIVRDYEQQQNVSTAILGDWKLRVPAIEDVSKDMVTYQGGKSVPSYIRVRNDKGEIITLDRYSELQEPNQHRVSGYVSQDGSKRIYLYKNVWRYVDGDVRWRSRGGGSPKPVFIGDSHSVDFMSDGSHHPQWFTSREGILRYEYVRDRLSVLSNNKGDQVRFNYLKNGLLGSINADSGSKINYRYNGYRQLVAVFDGRGNAIEYAHGDRTGELQGIRAQIEKSSSSIDKTARFQVEEVKPIQEEARAAKEFKRRRVHVIRVTYDTADNSVIRVGGEKISVDEFERTLTAILSNEGKKVAEHKQLVKSFFPGLDLDNRQVIVTGLPDYRQRMAEVLRRVLPTAKIATANQLSRALKLYDKSPAKKDRNSAKVLFMESKAFDNQSSRRIRRHTKDRKSYDTVIVVGHNDGRFEDFVRKAAETGEFKNKSVILLTCGANNLPGLIDLAFINNAREVVYFRAPIKTKDAARALETIQRGLRNGKTMQEVFDEIKKGTSIEKDLKNIFELIERQIGALWPSRFVEGLARYAGLSRKNELYAQVGFG